MRTMYWVIKRDSYREIKIYDFLSSYTRILNIVQEKLYVVNLQGLELTHHPSLIVIRFLKQAVTHGRRVTLMVVE